ncbi:MAG: hypothetical protein AB2809_22595 [Candidatus Thiodiazotropha sp.]
MMIYLESQKTAFNKDDDYETFEERWNNGITKQMGVIANTINDADVREAFVQKYKPKVEAQRQFIRALSLAKEQDHDTADILEKSQMLQNAFATSGDPEMINRGNELFDNSKGLSEEGKYKYRKAFGVGALKARLDSIATNNPQGAIELLNTDMARNNLPEGERAKQIADYQGRLVEQQAMGIVDDYTARDLSLSAGMDKAQKISDPKLREAVEKRFTYDKRMEEAAEVETQAKIHEDWHVRLGPKGDGSTIDDIPQEQWELLTPAQRQNLESLQFDKRTVSDFDVLNGLYQRLHGSQVDGDWTDFNRYLSENSSKLSYSDKKEFLKLTLEGQRKEAVPAELNTGRKDIQWIEGVMSKNEMLSTSKKANDRKKTAIFHELGLWRIEKQKQGKEPNDEEVLKTIDRLIMNYNVPVDWWPDSSEPFYAMSDEDRTKALEEMREDGPARHDLIISLLAQHGASLTIDEELMLMRDDMTDEEVKEWFNGQR